MSNATALGNSGPTWLERFRESSHPIAVIFFLLFRIGALLTYLFGLLFTKNFVLIFILVMLLLAADFWNVKNVSGRLLVGLRWWNEASATGESIWVFETADRYINPVDSRIFWFLLYISPALWIALGVLAILKFEFFWLILIGIALILTVTNAMAFSRCDKFGRANAVAGSFLTSGIFGRLVGLVTGRLF